MDKQLYHIECSQTTAIIHIRTILDKNGIENYIGDGGIHLHLTPNQVNRATELTAFLSMPLKEGMLPNTQKNINQIVMDFKV